MVRVAVGLVVMSLTALIWSAAGGCATAELKQAPDTGVFKDCIPGPVIFCDAGTITGPSCLVTGDDSDPRLRALDPNEYAAGCVVNFIGSGHDPNGDCVFNAVCICETLNTSASHDGGYAWNCGPPADAAP